MMGEPIWGDGPPLDLADPSIKLPLRRELGLVVEDPPYAYIEILFPVMVLEPEASTLLDDRSSWLPLRRGTSPSATVLTMVFRFVVASKRQGFFVAPPTGAEEASAQERDRAPHMHSSGMCTTPWLREPYPQSTG